MTKTAEEQAKARWDDRYKFERREINTLAGANTKYPYGAIAVGETFFIPLEDGDTIEKLDRRIRPGASKYGQRNGVKLSVNVERTPVPGLRVGRTA